MLLLNCQKKEESDSKIRTDASQVIKICVPLFVQGADDQTRKAITHYVLTVGPLTHSTLADLCTFSEKS